MSLFESLPILLLVLCLNHTYAATFDVRNNCPFTVWAAAVPVGGGRQLGQGETWSLKIPAGTVEARIWPRTNCNFDGSGRGICKTGDCNGLLQCQVYGQPPSTQVRISSNLSTINLDNTLAEISSNQSINVDFIDISLVDGFNVPIDISANSMLMEFGPNSVPMESSFNSDGCTRGIRCTGDINGQCPTLLRALGGCNDPCTVFKTDQYCCNSGICGPTVLSRYFKTKCPDAISYPKDDTASTLTCPEGTNYTVVFCP